MQQPFATKTIPPGIHSDEPLSPGLASSRVPHGRSIVGPLSRATVSLSFHHVPAPAPPRDDAVLYIPYFVLPTENHRYEMLPADLARDLPPSFHQMRSVEPRA